MGKYPTDKCLKCFYYSTMPSGNKGCLNFGDITNENCTMYSEKEKAMKRWKDSLNKHKGGGEKNV